MLMSWYTQFHVQKLLGDLEIGPILLSWRFWNEWNVDFLQAWSASYSGSRNFLQILI